MQADRHPFGDIYPPAISQVSATLIFFLSVVSNARRGVGASEFDEVSTSVYSVAAYLAIGSLGLWGFFRAHGVPLSPAEVGRWFECGSFVAILSPRDVFAFA